MEEHVPSLELCKKLKEVGYPQEGTFIWTCYRKARKPGGGEWRLEQSEPNRRKEIYKFDYIAPLASELMERLPYLVVFNDYSCLLEIHKGENEYGCLYSFNYKSSPSDFAKSIVVSTKDRCISNTLAKMYIYLAEHKLLEA